ncbi:MAG: hypothetical protein HY517_01375 [Candidatus Aenigmarchaeota archaeon]|nr:hypothetical protein [Candidatus Aenigmarchaeota archaeon]
MQIGVNDRKEARAIITAGLTYLRSGFHYNNAAYQKTGLEILGMFYSSEEIERMRPIITVPVFHACEIEAHLPWNLRRSE